MDDNATHIQVDRLPFFKGDPRKNRSKHGLSHSDSYQAIRLLIPLELGCRHIVLNPLQQGIKNVRVKTRETVLRNSFSNQVIADRW